MTTRDRVMAHLLAGNKGTPSEIARALNANRQTVESVLSNLNAKGFLDYDVVYGLGRPGRSYRAKPAQEAPKPIEPPTHQPNGPALVARALAARTELETAWLGQVREVAA